MSSVRIRMYRQGLGDCFLLTFPARDGERHVLIDCGVLKGQTDGGTGVRAAAANIAQTANNTLAALVLTHEHWDHVSGFVQAVEEFKDLKPNQAWYAWTEDPTDDLAQELGLRRRKAEVAVKSAARRLALAEGESATRVSNRVNALLEFSGGLAAGPGRTTRDGMAWPRQKSGTEIKYLRPGGAPLSIPGVDDVRVYVLGPPRDKKWIKKSDPSAKSSEVYELNIAGSDDGFMAAVEAQALDVTAGKPFDRWFGIDNDAARKLEFFRARYGFDTAGDDSWRRIEDEWLGAAGSLALRLDSDTNNTSLVLAFELLPSGRVLLFPGDAQVGNWLSWETLTWEVNEQGRARTIAVRDLLARTVLYKVGHHGSHNATLREKGLELMTSPELVAMLPVDTRTARAMDWNMPFPSLLRRLEARTRGRILDLERGIVTEKPQALSEWEWQQFQESAKVTDGWIDYHVQL